MPNNKSSLFEPAKKPAEAPKQEQKKAAKKDLKELERDAMNEKSRELAKKNPLNPGGASSDTL